ncbi:hypothetical protein QQ054_05975 [Oscillatoria amoena NRMC-F 0135]|nr:hypothetical protein [Geitlerinema splendidum]MDL5045585.1 hypothetical protein [Oscillatoria amoena NRMC-F 0135]
MGCFTYSIVWVTLYPDAALGIALRLGIERQQAEFDERKLRGLTQQSAIALSYRFEDVPVEAIENKEISGKM